ncbi:MAG: mandelate racemase/muconate lactonizing enzyme family protein [Candidatus Latescibacteria bacterium]|nr:mandelate racemase/muconate lactonizing enzyme family protein [Candidatus Latescibacterota bacterium]
MVITEIKLFPVRTPRETGSISQHVIVKIFTDDGIVGIGEMSDIRDVPAVPDLIDLEKRLTQMLRGTDPLDYNPGRTLVRRYGMTVGAGVEIGLYDLRGRILGVPVCYLLGGKSRDRIRVCYPIFSNPHDPSGEENVARVGRMLDQEFDLFRFYCGKGNLDADERFLQGVRQTYGDRVSFKSLDMSGQFTWHEAVKVVNRFERYGFMMVESPCWSMADAARARDRIGLPVSEHVHTVERARALIEAKATDIFNIEVTYGGFEHARKLFQLAEMFDVKTLIGTTQELSIGTAAQVHLGSAMPNLDFPCDPAGGRLYVKDVVVKRVAYHAGHLLVPEGPGLGVEIDEAKLSEAACPLHEGWP